MDALTRAAADLKAAGVDNPEYDARLLISHALTLNRAEWLKGATHTLSQEDLAAIEKLIVRRKAREPVARILGTREFWGLPFRLNEATLEPRPDSETLIEAVLNRMHGTGFVAQRLSSSLSSPKPLSPFRILDLGTGTGCLLLALLDEWPNATGLGIDLAPRAIEQAQINAAQLGLKERASFRVNNWVTHVDELFDIVISNPPYIAQNDIPLLSPEVRDHDPLLALDGGPGGSTVYHLLLPQLPKKLKPGGLIALEVGRDQAREVTAILRNHGFSNIEVQRDLGGIERCITATNG